MKKSLIFFTMLSGAIAFISCEDSNLFNARMEAVQDSTNAPGDSITVPVDSVITPVDTSSGIPVDTSTHVPVDTVGTHNVEVPLTGDEFIVTPLSAPDSLSGFGIWVEFSSVRSYQCQNSYLSYSYLNYDKGNNTYKIELYHVIQPGARYCAQGEKKVSGSTLIYPLSEGSQNLEIQLNGVTYKGKIIKTGNTYTIDWPYSAGVTFSKLTLTK